MAGSPLWRWCGAAAAAAIAAAGCSSPSQPESTPEVTVRWVGATLRDPVWSSGTHALIGLTDDGRLAEVSDPLSPQHGKTRLSPPMQAGRNLQISRTDGGQVFVPQPGRNKVAVVDLGTLRQLDEVDAGPAPAYLFEDAGLGILLALSADGLSVTPVDQHGYRKLATAAVTGSPPTPSTAPTAGARSNTTSTAHRESATTRMRRLHPRNAGRCASASRSPPATAPR